MALRRSKMREQVIQNLSQVAPPGEQFIACIHCETGPSPWLNILFEEIPFAMLIVTLMRKYYFITLTNGHLVVNRASRLSNRPKELVVAIPLQQVQISGIKKGKLWSRLYLQFPGEAKLERINFHRIWNSDIDQFIQRFPHALEDPSQAPAGGGYQQAYQQAPQQAYQQQPALQGGYQGQQQGYQQPAVPQQGQPMPQQYQQQPGGYQQGGYPQQQPGVPPQGQYPGQRPAAPQQYPGQQQYPDQGGYQR